MGFPERRRIVGLLALLALASANPSEAQQAAQAPGNPMTGASAAEPVLREPHSVVIASHLYSLYDPGRKPGRPARIAYPELLEAFGQELVRLAPRQVFLLGDNTRNARAEEWDFVQRVMAPLKGRVQFAAGNHDAAHYETFLAQGGVRRGSKVVGRNKYIQLDLVKSLDADALAFLNTELEDCEAFDHVFLLMHYFLSGWKGQRAGIQAEASTAEGQDPNAVARFTNWQSDVLPLIAGKVDVVFVGDYSPNHLRSYTDTYHGKQVRYVLNSFGFGFDERFGDPSEGPQVFLELRFDAKGDYSILPRLVPIDARHLSFGFAPERHLTPLLMDLAQVRYGSSESGVQLELAAGWKVKLGQHGQLRAWSANPLGEGRLEFSLRAIELESDDDAGRQRAIGAWLKAVAGGDSAWKVLQQESLPVDGKLGLWARARREKAGKIQERWSQVILHRGQAWSFTLSVPDRMQGEYLQLWSLILSRIRLTD